MTAPALDLWRRQLAAGMRTRETFDTLWRVACEEAAALELAWSPVLMRSSRAEIRRIIRDARRPAA